MRRGEEEKIAAVGGAAHAELRTHPAHPTSCSQQQQDQDGVVSVPDGALMPGVGRGVLSLCLSLEWKGKEVVKHFGWFRFQP